MASYKELIAERLELERKITAAYANESKTALATVKKIVVEFGFNATDIFGCKGVDERKKKKILLAKYENPETGATWVGRGKPPAWLAGISKEERAKFLIDK